MVEFGPAPGDGVEEKPPAERRVFHAAAREEPRCSQCAGGAYDERREDGEARVRSTRIRLHDGDAARTPAFEEDSLRSRAGVDRPACRNNLRKMDAHGGVLFSVRTAEAAIPAACAAILRRIARLHVEMDAERAAAVDNGSVVRIVRRRRREREFRFERIEMRREFGAESSETGLVFPLGGDALREA